jgi:hydroxyacylglutathione hydrolase
MKDKIDTLMPSHGKSPMDPDILVDMQAGVEKILAHKLRGKPSMTPFGNGLACRFGSCGVVYREDKM